MCWGLGLRVGWAEGGPEGVGGLVGLVAVPRRVNGIALHRHTHLENRGR